MDLKNYQQPITEICVLNTRVSVMIGGNPNEETSMQLTNEHRWQEDRFDDGLDDSHFSHTTPSLWDE